MNNKTKRIIAVIIATVSPLVACLILCLIRRTSPVLLYLPASGWNDEILYYKQIESIITYGKPLGYFGYNESTAALSTFGSWSPALFLLPAMWGRVFGWTFLSPFLFNITIMCISMAVIALFAKVTIPGAIAWSCCSSSVFLFSRYMLSGMVESQLAALCIIYAALVELADKTHEKKMKIAVISANVVLLFLSLCRGYFAALMLPLIYILIKRGKRITAIIHALLAVVYAAGFIIVTSVMCAPFFTDLIHTEWMKEAFRSPVAGLLKLTGVVTEVLRLTWHGVKDGEVYGGVCVAFFGVVCIMVYVGMRNKVMWAWAASGIVIMGALNLLYVPTHSARHLLALIVMFVAILVMGGRNNLFRQRQLFYAGLVLLMVFSFRRVTRGSYFYGLPVFDAQLHEQIQDGMAQMHKLDEIKESEWDYTVIWILGDDSPVMWNYLYAIPAGYGIQAVTKEYYEDNKDHLQSRYLFTNKKESIDREMEEGKKKLVAEYGGIHVWGLR